VITLRQCARPPGEGFCCALWVTRSGASEMCSQEPVVIRTAAGTVVLETRALLCSHGNHDGLRTAVTRCSRMSRSRPAGRTGC
jgi:hypothetical protein